LDTFSHYGPQAVGLNIYRNNEGIITGVGVKAQDVYKYNMTKAQLDSMHNRINADEIKRNNQRDSILRKIIR
jgi:hypothetical protein